jgi:hypothetical protein
VQAVEENGAMVTRSGEDLPLQAAPRNIFAREAARAGGPRDEPPAIVFLQGALRDNPARAPEIVAAALATAPDLADDIVAVATRLAPRAANEIQRVVAEAMAANGYDK